MQNLSWQLLKPISALIFDCDGTLSTIEGIDELAKNSPFALSVKALTEKAMAKSGITPEIYRERLDLVQPHRSDILAIGQQYYQHKVEDIEDVLTIFSRLGKAIYVVSAGISLAVNYFAKLLKIPEKNVFAVDIQFDREGKFMDFDHQSPLIYNTGKASIVNEIKKEHQHIIYIGDGLNDLTVRHLVTRFVGYGGSFYRKNIEDQSQFYMTTASMTPLLPLALTNKEQQLLCPEEKIFYDKGYQALMDGRVSGV